MDSTDILEGNDKDVNESWCSVDQDWGPCQLPMNDTAGMYIHRTCQKAVNTLHCFFLHTYF